MNSNFFQKSIFWGELTKWSRFSTFALFLSISGSTFANEMGVGFKVALAPEFRSGGECEMQETLLTARIQAAIRQFGFKPLNVLHSSDPWLEANVHGAKATDGEFCYGALVINGFRDGMVRDKDKRSPYLQEKVLIRSVVATFKGAPGYEQTSAIGNVAFDMTQVVLSTLFVK